MATAAAGARLLRRGFLAAVPSPAVARTAAGRDAAALGPWGQGASLSTVGAEPPPPPPPPPPLRPTPPTPASRDAAFGPAPLASSSGRPYRTYTPLSTHLQAAVAVGAAFGALLQPARADLVAAVGETTGEIALSRMLARMRADEEGRRILRDRPRVTSDAIAVAWTLPPSTFGGAYAQFMGTRHFSPDERPPVRFVANAELAYVAARAREVHDFWHVLFGVGTNVLGELALKWVELTQTGMPVAGLAALGGPLRLKPADRVTLATTYIPWALRAGLRASDLMCVHYEAHFAEDLDALRNRLRIIPAPEGTRFERKPRLALPPPPGEGEPPSA